MFATQWARDGLLAANPQWAALTPEQLDAFDARLNLQYGNFNAPDFQGMLNIPVTETFALRLAGRYFERESAWIYVPHARSVRVAS